MRTNIVLDDELVREALALSRIRTKRELVEQALREFAAFRKRLDVRELRDSGTLRGDCDYKGLRAGRGDRPRFDRPLRSGLPLRPSHRADLRISLRARNKYG